MTNWPQNKKTLVFIAVLLLLCCAPVFAQTYEARGTYEGTKTAFGTIAAAATTTVVPAVSGKSIVVYGIKIIGAGTVNVTVNSGSTAIDSPWPLTENTGVFTVREVGTTPIYRTVVGEALTLTTDSSGQLNYWFKYTEE